MLGVRYTLTQHRYVIGRSSSADIRIDNPTVSREHAELRLETNGWVIEDRCSTNGILVNNIPTKSEHLSDRDIVTLGNTTFKFLATNSVESTYHEEVYRITIMDALTQIHNRRYFFEALEREISSARRHKSPLSVIMIDLDNFKLVNDKHGHLTGDQVLKTLADRIRPKIRREDIFARYGGEEFVILLTRTPKKGAITFAHKVKNLISARPFDDGDLQIPLTISLGVATYDGQSDIKSSDLIDAADKHLYEAKQKGRNCVVG
jgi:diguanylate cyclase (GGDEF)-like protein